MQSEIGLVVDRQQDIYRYFRRVCDEGVSFSKGHKKSGGWYSAAHMNQFQTALKSAFAVCLSVITIGDASTDGFARVSQPTGFTVEFESDDFDSFSIRVQHFSIFIGGDILAFDAVAIGVFQDTGNHNRIKTLESTT